MTRIAMKCMKSMAIGIAATLAMADFGHAQQVTVSGFVSDSTSGEPLISAVDTLSTSDGSGTQLKIAIADRYFRGASCEVTAYADLSCFGHLDIDEDFDKICISRSATVCLQTLTEEGYDYLSAQNTLMDNDWDTSDLLQPVSLPNNVSGGVGFVSVFQSTSYAPIQLPSLEFSLYMDWRRGGVTPSANNC